MSQNKLKVKQKNKCNNFEEIKRKKELFKINLNQVGQEVLQNSSVDILNVMCSQSDGL